MPFWLAIIIFTAIVGGLSVGAFSMWIEFLKDQRKGQADTGVLEEVVIAQQEALKAAEQRIQVLETIVTSQEWDMIDRKGPVAADAPRPEPLIALDDSPDEPSDRERAAELAKRLRL